MQPLLIPNLKLAIPKRPSTSISSDVENITTPVNRERRMLLTPSHFNNPNADITGKKFKTEDNSIEKEDYIEPINREEVKLISTVVTNENETIEKKYLKNGRRLSQLPNKTEQKLRSRLNQVNTITDIVLGNGIFDESLVPKRELTPEPPKALLPKGNVFNRLYANTPKPASSYANLKDSFNCNNTPKSQGDIEERSTTSTVSLNN